MAAERFIPVAGTITLFMPAAFEYHLGGTGSLAGSETVYVNFTKRAVTQVESLMSASVTKYLQIDGLNCAQSGCASCCSRLGFQAIAYRCIPAHIEEFGSFTLNGKMAADTCKGAQRESAVCFRLADVATTDA